MKSWVRTLCLLSTLVLTGCSYFPTYQNSIVSCDQKSLCEKAVVVLNGVAPYKFFIAFKRDAIVYTIWERTEPSNSTGNTIAYKFDSYSLPHMVLPGTYRLTALGYTIGNNDYYIDELPCVTFTAAPGDFVYVGDIIIKEAVFGTKTPMLEDAYERACACVKMSYPGINKPLEKKLLPGLPAFTLEQLKQ